MTQKEKMAMFENIKRQLETVTDSIFLIYQGAYKIPDGDIGFENHFRLGEAVESLAGIIADSIAYQLEEV